MTQVIVELENNIPNNKNITGFACCRTCEISPEDFDDLKVAFDEYQAGFGSKTKLLPIKAIIRRDSLADILKQAQGGRCLGCHKQIGERWIVTGNVVLHEDCNLPPPAPLQARAQGKTRLK
jgi:hypothetical protein